MKRIYSLNLVAYLKMKGHEPEKIGTDENSNKKYYVFDESEEVAKDIKEYRKNQELHNFLRHFKQLKKEIHEC